MKSSLKKTLAAFTVISAGFLPGAVSAAQDFSFKAVEPKPAVENKALEQYPRLNEAKDEVNDAISLHSAAVSLLSNQKVLKKHKETIDQYNETVNRLNQNISCNKQQLSQSFSNPDEVWEKMSAWAEDSAATALADASGAMDNGVDPENVDLSKMSEDALNSDMDDLDQYAKVRWDVGAEVLKDVYAHPSKWGKVKGEFKPWEDQKHVYDVYLQKKYAKIIRAYLIPDDVTIKIPSVSDSEKGYLPSTYYSGEIPAPTEKGSNYSASSSNIDEVWCGASANGKAQNCPRVQKGSLATQHQQLVQQLSQLTLKPGYSQPDLSAPALPQSPLPPWREIVYITTTEKQLPELGSALPDPWLIVTQSIDNFNNGGEMANLVERSGNTVRYRPNTYDAATGEVKKDSKGNPMLPIPLTTNRISSYLALKNAEEQLLPMKEQAEIAVKEMNESVVSVLTQNGYTPRAGFDLSNDADYQEALNRLEMLQKNKISSAQAMMAKIQSDFASDLFDSVKQMIAEETQTLNALSKDSEFMVSVSRDNAEEIDSLIKTAIADAEANKTYEESLTADNEDAEDFDPVPPVGCPVI